MGGNGGNGGDGGSVSIANTQSLNTTGNGAAGIVARSLGGVGGAVGTGGTPTYGQGGAGGAVLVSTTNTIHTSNTNAHGVMAQSLGGVGYGSNSQGLYGENGNGTAQHSGAAGPVTVVSGSDINTVSSTNGYGIIAQSIASSGGFNGTGLTQIGNNGFGNFDSGPVIVQLNAGGSILTSGAGTGAGVLAQSISGGGGAGSGAGPLAIGGLSIGGGVGNAGNVTVTNNGDAILSGGTAIHAQSIGGGGGIGTTSGSDLSLGGVVLTANAGTATAHYKSQLNQQLNDFLAPIQHLCKHRFW